MRAHLVILYVGVVAALWLAMGHHENKAATSSADARVVNSQTLNCGYVPYYPAMLKNEQTGVYEGYDVDVMNALAQRMGLKLNWATESSWMTVATDMENGKFDMFCNTYWTNPKTAQHVLYSRPVYYQPLFVIARADDTRFDADLGRINSPDIKVAVLDGDAPVAIVEERFPKAQLHSLSHNLPFSQVLVEVADKKADVTISDTNNLGGYLAQNPGKLKVVRVQEPVRIFPVSFLFGPDDHQLKNAVDNALHQMILEGSLDKILDKYEQNAHAVYRAQVPLRNPYKD